MDMRSTASPLPLILSRIALFAGVLISLPLTLTAQKTLRFTCAASLHHAIPLSTGTRFNATPSTTGPSGETTFGFDLRTAPTAIANGSCAGSKTFFFSVSEPEGDYQVTVVLGGTLPSTTTVRAESRRLFVDQATVSANGSRRYTFNVSTRIPDISPRDGSQTASPPPQVKLKAREIGALDWDSKLTLEFTGDRPSIRSITFRPIHHIPTLYIAGDSTVVDQTEEPWTAWGQMLPLFFNSKISIANEAESGETIRSFIAERRLDKIMSTLSPGDYLMLQFGHNDQKPGRGYVPAETEFKSYLLRYISDARAHGAIPILVTPMNRRRFDANGKIIPTLGDYPEVMRQAAAQQHVALIDLNGLSKTLFDTMGESGTLHAFVHYPANTFPGQPQELKDDTHFNSYGAYELARAIVQSIRDQKLPLAHDLRRPIPPFDPAHPDPFAAWTLPPSPNFSAVTPYSR